LPIVRITKEQIEKANEARKAALLKDPEFRAYDERQQLQRQAASKQNEQIKDANKAPCDERQRQRKAVEGEMEQDS